MPGQAITTRPANTPIAPSASSSHRRGLRPARTPATMAKAPSHRRVRAVEDDQHEERGSGPDQRDEAEQQRGYSPKQQGHQLPDTAESAP